MPASNMAGIDSAPIDDHLLPVLSVILPPHLLYMYASQNGADGIIIEIVLEASSCEPSHCSTENGLNARSITPRTHPSLHLHTKYRRRPKQTPSLTINSRFGGIIVKQNTCPQCLINRYTSPDLRSLRVSSGT